MECAQHVFPLAGLLRVVRIQECRLHETRGRIRIARDAARTGARAEGGKLGAAPGRSGGKVTRCRDIGAQVRHVPGELGLIRQRVDWVVHHMKTVSHLLDHDRARVVTHNPVQHRHAELVAHRLRDDIRVREGRLHFIDRREVRRNPNRELISGDVCLPVNRALGIFSEPGEVQAGNAQTRIVSAIEVERVVVEHDRHTDHGVRGRRVIEEGVGEREARGRHHHALAVARVPIKVARQIHVALAVAESDSRAHIASFREACPSAPARIGWAFLPFHRAPGTFKGQPRDSHRCHSVIKTPRRKQIELTEKPSAVDKKPMGANTAAPRSTTRSQRYSSRWLFSFTCSHA